MVVVRVFLVVNSDKRREGALQFEFTLLLLMADIYIKYIYYRERFNKILRKPQATTPSLRGTKFALHFVSLLLRQRMGKIVAAPTCMLPILPMFHQGSLKLTCCTEPITAT